MGTSRDNGFTRLGEDHPLVDKLLTEAWWQEIVEISHADPDINIQLRSNSINIYSKMGNLLRISLQKNKVCCEIHYKYLIADKKSPYVSIALSDGRLLMVNNNECPNIQDVLKDFKTIKQNIAIYAGEEKTIQSRLVEKNKETIIDVEVAFSGITGPDGDGGDNARIDLVNFDKNLRKIIFVELKQAFDSRLYNGEINKQIEKYYDFALKHEGQIINAYQNAINTKKKLGIIKDTSFLANARVAAIEPRPLLVIAGYNQQVIDSLKCTIEINIDPAKKAKHLAGLYFFGSDTDLNLQKKNLKNKEIFT